MLTRITLLLLAVSSAACGGPSPFGPPACQLAAEQSTCPECFSGTDRCEYDDVSVTEDGCNGCQARAALFHELCARGVDDSRDQILENLSCETVQDRMDPEG